MRRTQVIRPAEAYALLLRRMNTYAEGSAEYQHYFDRAVQVCGWMHPKERDALADEKRGVKR